MTMANRETQAIIRKEAKVLTLKDKAIKIAYKKIIVNGTSWKWSEKKQKLVAIPTSDQNANDLTNQMRHQRGLMRTNLAMKKNLKYYANKMNMENRNKINTKGIIGNKRNKTIEQTGMVLVQRRGNIRNSIHEK